MIGGPGLRDSESYATTWTYWRCSHITHLTYYWGAGILYISNSAHLIYYWGPSSCNLLFYLHVILFVQITTLQTQLNATKSKRKDIHDKLNEYNQTSFKMSIEYEGDMRR